MNRKEKLRYRAVLSLILSAVLFCMPVAAFSMSGDNAIDARAEDSVESGSEEETENTAEESHAEQEAADQETSEPETAERETEGSTGESTEEQTEGGTEGETEGGTVSGNEVPEPECTCEKRGSAYDFDKDCEVCAADYKDCEIRHQMLLSISTVRADGTTKKRP